MFKLLFFLALLLHGAFAVAFQHFLPDKLVSVLAPKRAAVVHALFPPTIYPPSPSGLSGYTVGVFEILFAFFTLKRLCRL